MKKKRGRVLALLCVGSLSDTPPQNSRQQSNDNDADYKHNSKNI